MKRIGFVMVTLLLCAGCNSSSSGSTSKQSYPATPVGSLESAVSAKLGNSNLSGAKSRVLGVTSSKGLVIVRFLIDDNVTSNFRREGSKMDEVKVLEVVQAHEASFPKMRQVGVAGYFPEQNKYGKSTMSEVVEAVFTRKVLNKINYADIDPSTIDNLATFTKIAPEFQ